MRTSLGTQLNTFADYVSKRMTVNEARKLLGKDSTGISDQEIQHDIDTATLLKDLFFNITTSKTENKILWHNGHNVNET